MPYVPHSLSDLLTSPSFSPRPLRGGVSAPQEAQFSLLAKSVMYQIVSAVAYLHDRRIAHRDIKPNNVLLTEGACVKLIDFGISWKEDEDESMKKGDLWPEYPGKMYFEVSTGYVAFITHNGVSVITRVCPSSQDPTVLPSSFSVPGLTTRSPSTYGVLVSHLPNSSRR
jgi:serine/threonine protein kinase